MSNKKTQENSFPHRLRLAMGKLGLSQHELAALLGTTQSTVSGWLNRGSLPRGDLLGKVAETLGVQEAWLAFGDASDSPSGMGVGEKSKSDLGKSEAMSDVIPLLGAANAKALLDRMFDKAKLDHDYFKRNAYAIELLVSYLKTNPSE